MTSGDPHDQTEPTDPHGGQPGGASYAQPGPPPPPYGAYPPPPGYPPPYGYQLPRHPDAMTAVVLGGLSIAVLPLLGPFAWYVGNKSLREMREQPGRWSGDDLSKIGMVLGIVATALCALGLLMIVMFVVIGAGVLGGAALTF